MSFINKHTTEALEIKQTFVAPCTKPFYVVQTEAKKEHVAYIPLDSQNSEYNTKAISNFNALVEIAEAFYDYLPNDRLFKNHIEKVLEKCDVL